MSVNHICGMLGFLIHSTMVESNSLFRKINSFDGLVENTAKCGSNMFVVLQRESKHWYTLKIT